MSFMLDKVCELPQWIVDSMWCQWSLFNTHVCTCATLRVFHILNDEVSLVEKVFGSVFHSPCGGHTAGCSGADAVACRSAQLCPLRRTLQSVGPICCLCSARKAGGQPLMWPSFASAIHPRCARSRGGDQKQLGC